ncbi:MAG: monofunctional biosynthetic peptidoglycan transglycosylase [Vicinamibacterales bacterium]
MATASLGGRRKASGGRIGRLVGGVVGVAFAVVAYLYVSLPDVRPLRTANPATTAFMEIRAAEAHAAGKLPKRQQQWVPLGRMAPGLRRAVIVAEDSAFWQHDGIDLQQIRESVQANLERGERLRGASTITQQLAKNLYLSPSKNPLRKLRELLLARRLERVLGKRRILEIYLNVIEWGDGIYGAEAAARAYFGKSADSLSDDEAALLAGAIINPRRYSPANPPKRLLNRQRMILERLHTVSPGS